MKKLFCFISLLLIALELSAQSNVLLFVDSPLVGPVKPKYQLLDYSIPFKSTSIVRGAYQGFEIIFSEDETKKEFYSFIVELPLDNKLLLKLLSDELPVILKEEDFYGIFSERLNTNIPPKINLEKYSRSDNNTLSVEILEFKSFTLTISELKLKSDFINIKAIINGAVFFSSETTYDAPYEINAVVEIIDEEISLKLVD